MNGKKAYVSPQVIRVKLEPSQAVLSQCEVNSLTVKVSHPLAQCSASHGGCKQSDQPGDDAATS